jgi:hypothetical protein
VRLQRRDPALRGNVRDDLAEERSIQAILQRKLTGIPKPDSLTALTITHRTQPWTQVTAHDALRSFM